MRKLLAVLIGILAAVAVGKGGRPKAAGLAVTVDPGAPYGLWLTSNDAGSLVVERRGPGVLALNADGGPTDLMFGVSVGHNAVQIRVVDGGPTLTAGRAFARIEPPGCIADCTLVGTPRKLQLDVVNGARLFLNGLSFDGGTVATVLEGTLFSVEAYGRGSTASYAVLRPDAGTAELVYRPANCFVWPGALFVNAVVRQPRVFWSEPDGGSALLGVPEDAGLPSEWGDAGPVLLATTGSVVGSPRYGPGRTGLAFQFDGGPGVLFQVPSSFDLLGVSLWVNWTGTFHQTVGLVSLGSAAGPVEVRLESGRLNVLVDGKGLERSFPLKPGEWQNVVINAYDKRAELWVNGVSRGSVTYLHRNYSGAVTIGSNAHLDAGLTGLVDDIRIYPHVLELDELVHQLVH